MQDQRLQKKLIPPAVQESIEHENNYYKAIHQMLKQVKADALEIFVTIEGKKLGAVLDTGAELNVIGPETLETIPNQDSFPQLPIQHKTVQTANGELVSVIKCVYIPVMINDKTYYLLFHVIPQTNLLLGITQKFCFICTKKLV